MKGSQRIARSAARLLDLAIQQEQGKTWFLKLGGER